MTEKLHQNTFWMGRGGTLTHTISGIDIALWDILGKATGLSVGRLLGGGYRTRVQPYCSLLMEEPEGDVRCRRAVSRAQASGLQDRLGSVRPRARRQARRGDRARRARGGGRCRQAVRRCRRQRRLWPHGLKWAMRTAEMLADSRSAGSRRRCGPTRSTTIGSCAALSRVPIAGGEVLTRRQAFIPWLTRGAFDIVQPDVTKVGGISEQRRIAWMAYDFGVKYVGHGWNTALGVAADLQLASAFPDADLVEFIGGSPYVDGILAEPFTLDADG